MTVLWKANRVLWVVISAILIVSGIAKTITYESFVYTIDSYEIIPTNYINVVAFCVIFIECMLGIMMVLEMYPNVIFKCTIILFLGFAIFTLWSVLTDKNYICNCFGGWYDIKITYTTVLRNCILLLGALFLEGTNRFRPQKVYT